MMAGNFDRRAWRAQNAYNADPIPQPSQQGSSWGNQNTVQWPGQITSMPSRDAPGYGTPNPLAGWGGFGQAAPVDPWGQYRPTTPGASMDNRPAPGYGTPNPFGFGGPIMSGGQNMPSGGISLARMARARGR